MNSNFKLLAFSFQLASVSSSQHAARAIYLSSVYTVLVTEQNYPALTSKGGDEI